MSAYTADPTAAGEARIQADLDRIVAAVRHEAQDDDLRAVFLLGGYAKGEGAVVSVSGALHGFNDYDLLLVFGAAPKERQRYATLSARLARELEIDFVDLGLATPRDLECAPATLFWYDLGEAHRRLWSAPGTEIEPRRLDPTTLEEAEGTRLLLNRGMALLWAGLRLWPEGRPGEGRPVEDSRELRFAVIAAHKAVAAAGDAVLLRAGLYSTHQSDRLDAMRSRPELVEAMPSGFGAAYEAAAAYRRTPRPYDPAAAAALWWASRAHHEAGFRSSEEARLGATFAGWDEHATRLRAEGRRRLGSPREAVRAVRRSLRDGEWLPEEDRFLLALPPLLYGVGPDPAGGAARPEPARDEPSGESARWRERSEAAVRRWHP